MTPLLAYLVKVIICSGILYAYYHIALRNNRFHQWNRYYLLLCTMLSLVVPLLRIPLPKGAISEQAGSIYVYTSQVVTLREQVLTSSRSVPFTNFDWITVCYCAVSLVLLIFAGIGYGKILRLVRRSQVEYVKPYWLVLSEQIIQPFSFFKYIFWNRDSYTGTAENRQVLRHEIVHLQENHSSDKLFMEIVTALCWINPFFHLIKRELALVHEFIADKKAAMQGNVADYAQTILQMALQTNRNFKLANHFSHHPIKRRILMLTQSRRLRFSYLRRLLIFPVALLIFSSLAFVVAEERIGQEVRMVVYAPTPRPKADLSTFHPPANKEIFTFVEEPPKFPGGDHALMAYLNRTIHYPPEAMERGISGTLFVSFVIDNNGKLQDAKIVGKRKGGGLEEEALRVVESMPDWIPGKQNGKQVNVQFNLPIRFTLIAQSEPGKVETPVTLSAAEMPAFPGGNEELNKYLARTIRYPGAALNDRLQGNVSVSFIIREDGSINDIQVTSQPIGGGLEEEAIRIVSKMPHWKPGVKNGQPISVRYHLPIAFRISE